MVEEQDGAYNKYGMFQFFGMAVEFMIMFMQNINIVKEQVGLETALKP